jgi:hypothetical protein
MFGSSNIGFKGEIQGFFSGRILILKDFIGLRPLWTCAVLWT